MAAPTFVADEQTAWNTSTSPKTTAAISVTTGDSLVVVGITGDQADTLTLANSGTAQTWTLKQDVNVASYCRVLVWTATSTVTASMTVTLTKSGAAGTIFGGNFTAFGGSDGIGASSKTNVSSGAPTLNLLTTQANSAIVVVNGDWAAIDGAARVWRANAGALTESSYFRNTTDYAIYSGFHADAGAVTTYAVGLSAPAGQKYAIAAVEVLGTAGGAPVIPPALVMTPRIPSY